MKKLIFLGCLGGAYLWCLMGALYGWGIERPRKQSPNPSIRTASAPSSSSSRGYRSRSTWGYRSSGSRSFSGGWGSGK